LQEVTELVYSDGAPQKKKQKKKLPDEEDEPSFEEDKEGNHPHIDDVKDIMENREVYGDPDEKSPAGSQAEEGEESDPGEPEPSG